MITVGKRPDNREIQECHTFRTMTETLKKQAEIRDARDKGRFVKRDSVTPRCALPAVAGQSPRCPRGHGDGLPLVVNGGP
jgi:hypothetical protein